MRKNRDLVLSLANYETKKSYDQSKLAMMLQYAETTSCRRRFILNYFGEDFDSVELRRVRQLPARAPARGQTRERLPAGSKSPTWSHHPKFGIGHRRARREGFGHGALPERRL